MTLYYSLVGPAPLPLHPAIDIGIAANSTSKANYSAQVFVLLVAEMLLFVALIVPVPFTIRRKMFNFISESPIVAKLQYGMKVCRAPR